MKHIKGLVMEKSQFKVKTSLRIKYEAEVSVIKTQIGHLEDIRFQLGLSKRKMAQLLLVDPSTWSRWTAMDFSTPPHIYRALQWYLALQEKIPGLNHSYWLQNLSIKDKQIETHTENRNSSENLEETIKIKKELNLLRTQIKYQRYFLFILLALIFIIFGQSLKN